MDDNQPKAEGEADKKIVHVYPLIKYSEMTDEMRVDVIDMLNQASEKYSSNYEAAAKAIKEAMDKKYGAFWHCIIGEGFGYEISYEKHKIVYLFFGGNVAAVLWKC
jgi:dynein light chain 4